MRNCLNSLFQYVKERWIWQEVKFCPFCKCKTDYLQKLSGKTRASRGDSCTTLNLGNGEKEEDNNLEDYRASIREMFRPDAEATHHGARQVYLTLLTPIRKSTKIPWTTKMLLTGAGKFWCNERK